MRKNINGKGKLHKRIISATTALMMTACCLPLSELKEITTVISAAMKAYAEDTEPAGVLQSFTTVSDFVQYARNYTKDNRNDTLKIAFGSQSTFGEFKDENGNSFDTMAKTEDAAFNGKIILGEGVKLNIPVAMFGWVTDNVEIQSSDNGNEIKIARTSDSSDEPLFAKHVKHSRTDDNSVQWSISSQSYMVDSLSTSQVFEFAGFIGALESQAKVQLDNVDFNNSANKIIGISSTGDIGLVCGTLKSSATLQIDTISVGSSNYDVKSTGSGNAGAIVGSMENAATLTLGSAIVNPQATGKTIEAKSGYAGGIVGKCDGGTIDFQNSSAYVLGQVINGSAGAGGIAGYYKDAETGNYIIEVKSGGKFSFSGGDTPDCKVNGSGHCGALFGEVVNQGNMTISYDAAFYSNHTAGAAASYGALIGKYSSNALSNSLQISSSSTVTPKRTGGSVSILGGLIGFVEDDSYIKLENVNVNVPNAAASTFGGLISKAPEAFIDLNGAVIGYNGVSTDKTFGGVVGNLKDGVLYLQGSLDLSGTPAVTTASATAGQIVGYRDYGLVFAADGWTLTRSTNSQTLDDIGSWGEVVRGEISALTINTSDHYVTLSPAVTTMTNRADFVKTALNIQLNKGQTSGVLRCSGDSSATLLASNALELTSSANLTGTGITGLTRDNGDECVLFTGTFDGKDNSITLVTGESYPTTSDAEGKGKIYRHQYNGLFAKTNGATIKNLKIAAGSTINVKALTSMYVGNVVGLATGNLTLDTVEVCAASGSTAAATISNDGTDSAFGGLVGELTAAGTVSVNSCAYKGVINKGTINGTPSGATTSYIGGLIGKISESPTFGITISDTEIGGTITAASGNEIGGMIAVITATGNTDSYPSTGRTLALTDVVIDGETITSAGGCGGLLGCSWYETDVSFYKTSKTAGLAVGTTSAPSITSAGTMASGLVNTATGYWQVRTDGIKITRITVNAPSATSFGMLINTGVYKDAGEVWGDEEAVKSSAIYLELAPGAYTVTGDTLTLTSVTVFDELVAYSANGDVTKNGQGIVSIATSETTENNVTTRDLLKMDDSSTGMIYAHQTNYIKDNTDNAAQKINSHTRYYYNLDKYRTPSGNAQEFLLWSVQQYAHKTLKSYFSGHSYYATDDDAENNVSTIGAENAEFNMRGYSYYPVDVTGSVTISGDFKLYNSEFNTSQHYTNDAKHSLQNDNQHYTLHNALFQNVSGSLTANKVKLDGNVNVDTSVNGSGALVLGTIESDESAYPARVTVNGLILDGIRVGTTNVSDSAYAPLLINKAGSNATINITDVKNYSTTTSNAEPPVTTETTNYSAGAIIASSLLGKIGTATAQNVNLTFSKIKLDGRNDDPIGDTNLNVLDNVYHTTRSLFSRATLVDTLAYADYSGSQGIYDYSEEEDWGTGNRQVTYGYEISGSAENKEGNESKQLKYKPATNYTNPVTQNGGKYEIGSTDGFTTYFQRYVRESFNSTKKTHELKVNLQGGEFSGCGTYNDPYILTSGADLTNIACIINGDSVSLTICVPNTIIGDTMPSPVPTWCSSKNTTSHRQYTVRDGDYWYTDSTKVEATKLKNDVLREYLAGAYYKIEDGKTITLGTGYPGISNLTTKDDPVNNIDNTSYVFRGVIDGSGQQIVNTSPNPLIVASNGSVVYNLRLEIAPEASKALTQTASKPFLHSGTVNTDRCDAYGAVISQIFGGDNIIDDVSVKFTGTIVDANSAEMAQLVPIGGYVGVVVGGGLIFRNMKGYSATNANNQNGIAAANLAGFTGGTGDVTSATNTKWLYVNPIIGRVLNGYAITESSSYKPFEDGTRTYPDGSKTIFNGNSFVSVDKDAEYSGTTVGVTMRNGTKNYSIPDLSTSDTQSFEMAGIEDGDDINISSAQSLHLMSLIIGCGLGKSTTGKYTQTGWVLDKTAPPKSQQNYLKPYDSYMSTHLAGYHYVGNSSLTGAAPTTASTAAQTDYLAAVTDVFAGSGTDKIPYIIKTYTPYDSVHDIYPAFDAAGGVTDTSAIYHDLILKSTTDTSTTTPAPFYLPDSYRGLGALLFGVKVLKRNEDGSLADGKEQNLNLDNFKENVVFLSSLDGCGRTVSLNMGLNVYSDDNYPTMDGHQAYFKNGFGLINSLQTPYSTSENSTPNSFKDITIKGSVAYGKLDTNGARIENTAANLQKANPNVSAFIGVPVAEKDSGANYCNIAFDNISLDSMELTGLMYAGGYLGTLNIKGKLTFTGCHADDLKVYAGGAAGGLIGYMRNQYAKVVADFTTDNNECGTFGIIRISSAAEAYSIGERNTSYAGAGGLIGDRNSSNAASAENITISNVIICNGSSVKQGYIGYEKADYKANPDAGGIIGHAAQSTLLNANHVTVQNLNICGKYAGGMVGELTGTNSTFTISNSAVIAEETAVDDSTPPKTCRIEGTYNNNASAAGGFIGRNNAPAASKLTDSVMTGYTISGYQNIGGLIGLNDGAGVTATNLTLDGYTLTCQTSEAGGLIGELSAGTLDGYNILSNNQTVKNPTKTNTGYLIGKNNSQTVKLVGFSRQGRIDTALQVGNKVTNGKDNADRYGTNGYVIFADYDNTGNTLDADAAEQTIAGETDEEREARLYPGRNKEPSNMMASGTNLGMVGDHVKATTRTYKIVAHEGQIVGDPIEVSDPVVDETGAFDPSLGERTETSYSGSVVKYAPNTNADPSTFEVVDSFADLTGDAAANGLYMYSNAGSGFITVNTRVGEILSPRTGNNQQDLPVVAFNANTAPVLWHFELVNASDHTYRIYTKEGGINYYIQNNSDTTKDVYLKTPLTTDSSVAAVFKASDAYAENTAWNNTINASSLSSTQKATYTIKDLDFYINSFYFKKANFTPSVTNDFNDANANGKPILSLSDYDLSDYLGSYLQYNSGRNSYRYYTNHFASGQYNKPSANNNYDSNRSAAIKLLIPPASEVLKAYDYTAFNISGTTITLTGTSSDSAMEDYETDYATYCGSYNDTTYELYYITETVRKNVYVNSLGHSPYVTTSPKYTITTKLQNGERVSAQWLTGDGVTYTGYHNSTSKKILEALMAPANDPKRYQTTGIALVGEADSVNNLTSLKSFLASHMSGIKTAVSPDESVSYTYKGEDFPVLVVDDRDTANTYLKNYLKLLTNTNFAFDTSQSSIYDVNVSKWVYSSSSETFVPSSDEASLKYNGNFSINTTDADNNNWQISLVDVQFKDPSDTAASPKIAYHLYVPVIVKKMLHYYQMIRPSSGTVYDLAKYPNSEDNNLIDNFGNPVTVKLTYVYERSAEEWEKAINNGENVYRNYTKKQISVKVTGNRIPADAKIVMLDPNHDKDQYYYGNFSTASVLTDPRDDGSDKVYLLKLQNFDEFTDDSIVKLNELMSVTEDTTATEKNLVVTNVESECTVKLDDGTMLKKAPEGTPGTHAVKVTIPEGSVTVDGRKQHYLEENYYLSIFTKTTDTDTQIYHFELNGINSFGDGNNPSARINKDVSHMFLGNLYYNSITLAETNEQPELSENNLSIGAKLTATVGFTETAVNRGICDYIDLKNNVHVYHTFMVSLNEVMEDSSSVRGIQVDPIATPSMYKIDGQTTDTNGRSLDEYFGNCDYSPGCIAIPSSYDIISKLKDKAMHPSQTDGYNFDIEANVDLLYDSSFLAAQFPPKAENAGTYMIGYSNLSSSQESGSASRASDNTDKDNGTSRTHYYINDITSVDFSYRVAHNSDLAFKDDGNGDHGQLGINANELDNNTPTAKDSSSICSNAYYDASGYSLKSSARFVKIRVWLSKKADYASRQKNDSSKALNLEKYLKSFQVLDKNHQNIVTNEEKKISVTRDGDVITYIVPIADESQNIAGVLQTASEDEQYSFIVPIQFEPYSGKNVHFEGVTEPGENEGDPVQTEVMEYSNYRMTVEMGLLAAEDSEEYLTNSNATDFIVYTNARLKSDILTP